MCGLVALHTAEKGGFSVHDRDEFKQMLVLNSLRGIHSTGIAGVNARIGGEVNITKAVGSPYNLFTYPAANQVIDRISTSFTTVIGHGRYATQGAVNATNAHPFRENQIVLAHNGVIRNYFELKDFTKHKHIEVDSQLIAHLISTEGAENILPQVQGAYVFMWYDSEQETFNIARNKERPLFGVKQKGKETLTFASEYQTLLWNGDRNNTEYEDVFEIPEHQIFTYHADSIMPEMKTYEPILPKIITYGKEDGSYETNKSPRKTSENLNDRVILEGATHDSSLKVGSDYTFIIDDFKQSENGYTAITGSNKMYPNVLFRTSVTSISDADLFESEFVSGTLLTIYPAREADTGFDWQVFLGEPKFHRDEEGDDETIVDIKNVLGHTEGMSKYRLKELASVGCAWCQEPHTEEDLKTPSKLLVWDTDKNTQEIVCSGCASGTLSTFH
jgi:hypothetical protein